MTVLLQHYRTGGSASGDWLREMRAIEAEADPSPLGTTALEPQSAPAPERAVYTREDFASFVDQDRADRRAWAENDDSYRGVGSTFR